MNNNFLQEIRKLKTKGILLLLFGIFYVIITLVFLLFFPDIFPNLFKGGKHSLGNNIVAFMVIGNICYWIYFRIFAIDFQNKIKEEFAPKIMKDLVQDNGNVTWVSDICHIELSDRENNNISGDISDVLTKECGAIDFFQIFKGFCSFEFNDIGKDSSVDLEDFFYGTYKGVDFASVEAEILTKRGKYYWTVFKGLIIEIKTNRIFSPMLIKSNSQPYLKMPYRYVKINNGALSSKYRVYIEGGTEIPQFPASFYSFINDLWKMFSFGFIEDRIVIIVNSKRNLFELASLFKSLNDESQYNQFKKEFFLMLNIVENLPKFTNEENI